MNLRKDHYLLDDLSCQLDKSSTSCADLFAGLLPPFLCFSVSSVSFPLGILWRIVFHLFFVFLGPVVSCCSPATPVLGPLMLLELDLKNPGKVESNLVSPCVLRLTCYALRLLFSVASLG